MSKIVFTGFGTWGSHTINPSWECLKAFVPETHDREAFTVKPLPVLWGVGDLHLISGLRDITRCVVAFGLADSRTKVSIETLAFNERNADLVDASGQLAPTKKIDADAPETLPSTFPAEKLLEALEKNDIPTELSQDAGRFICNETLFALLNHARKNQMELKAGFIHVPPLTALSREQWQRLPQVILEALS